MMARVILYIIVKVVRVGTLNGQLKIVALIIVRVIQLLGLDQHGHTAQILEGSTKVQVMHVLIVMQNVISVMVLQILIASPVLQIIF